MAKKNVKDKFQTFLKGVICFTLADDSISVFSFDYVVKEISRRCSWATVEL